MTADLDVAHTAYATARQLGASPKVMLSLFEAGLVESNFHNDLTATDHDSLGYLQQRPSMGWPNPTDVATATRSYVTRAIANDRARPSMTPGQLAQSVQRSAFPGRYDQRQADAVALLKQVTSGTWTAPAGTPPTTATDASLTDSLSDAAGTLRGMVGSVASLGTLASTLTKLALPTNLVRLVAGILGIGFLFFGITILGKQARNG